MYMNTEYEHGKMRILLDWNIDRHQIMRCLSARHEISQLIDPENDTGGGLSPCGGRQHEHDLLITADVSMRGRVGDRMAMLVIPDDRLGIADDMSGRVRVFAAVEDIGPGETVHLEF